MRQKWNKNNLSQRTKARSIYKAEFTNKDSVYDSQHNPWHNRDNLNRLLGQSRFCKTMLATLQHWCKYYPFSPGLLLSVAEWSIKELQNYGFEVSATSHILDICAYSITLFSEQLFCRNTAKIFWVFVPIHCGIIFGWRLENVTQIFCCYTRVTVTWFVVAEKELIMIWILWYCIR